MTEDGDTEPRFPDVTVQLTGRDSNAGSIMAGVSEALRDAGVDSSTINAWRMEAMSGNYEQLLATAMRWVYVE